jgi:hypothetical protein
MASGHVNRTNRPNTWLYRPATRREDFPCQPGAVHTWHFSGETISLSLGLLIGVKRKNWPLTVVPGLYQSVSRTCEQPRWRISQPRNRTARLLTAGACSALLPLVADMFGDVGIG